MNLVPFGLAAGLSGTALPFLLTSAHVPLDRVASISALLLSPSFWGVLFAPIVDTGFTRRTHAFLLAGISIACIGAGLWMLSPQRLFAMTALLLAGNLAMYVYAAAVLGWTADFVPDTIRGRVGGWSNAANLGAGAAGALLTMQLAQRLSLHVAAGALVALMTLSLMPLLFYPRPGKSKLAPRHAIFGTVREVWQTSKRRSSLIGFALFLSPTGAFGVSNLFSGLGNDFHADPQRVIWITGAGVSIATALGSLTGGFIADRFPRGFVYLGGGIGAALCAAVLAVAHRTTLSFGVGVLAYSVGVGVGYASFSALALQLVGFEHAVAGTQITLFGSVGNAAIVYMTWLDGQGYRLFGLRGLFAMDAGLSLLTAVPLLWLVHRELSRQRRDAVPAAAQPSS
jgi:MFS family permease